MAQYWSAAVADAIAAGKKEPFNFIDIMVTPSIHLTDWDGDIEIDGVTYVAGLIRTIDPPKRSRKVNQGSQRIEIVETLNAFTADDFITSLGDYYGATVVARSFIRGLNDQLLTDPIDVFHRNEGLLMHAAKARGGQSIVLDISNSYGKLDQLKELRTTRGSMIARNPNDSSFNRADGITDNSVLEWGS
jgi:hypothetical protein